ncbi:MAG TPA: LuxR C-terminal-related transcriptional regulator, partial [Candidatus Limnocylindrales bacterium]|nr:LuxR C-terminal-related transcriptional regulator [Candidatus Limnocylindrales bacterium]
VPLIFLYTDVIPAALTTVGDRWKSGAISAADEHIATGIVRDGLYELGRRAARRPQRNLTILVAAVEEELHDLPTRIVSDMLTADGWIALCVGASTPIEALARLVIDREPDAVALSATMPQHLDMLRASVARLRAPDVPPTFIVVGGQALAGLALDSAPLGADVVELRADRAAAHLAAFAARRRAGPDVSDLTPREQVVLTLIGEGLTNREIAGRLEISEATAKTHVRHILDKLGVRNRVEAAMFGAAAQSGPSSRIATSL